MTELNDELTAVLDKEVAILERGDFRERHVPDLRGL